jgi:hypothetical protein
MMGKKNVGKIHLFSCFCSPQKYSVRLFIRFSCLLPSNISYLSTNNAQEPVIYLWWERKMLEKFIFSLAFVLHKSMLTGYSSNWIDYCRVMLATFQQIMHRNRLFTYDGKEKCWKNSSFLLLFSPQKYSVRLFIRFSCLLPSNISYLSIK